MCMKINDHPNPPPYKIPTTTPKQPKQIVATINKIRLNRYIGDLLI